MTDEHDAVLRFVLDVHAAPLHRYVLRLTGNNATAEDIVQDALFRLWRHPEVLEQIGRASCRDRVFRPV